MASSTELLGANRLRLLHVSWRGGWHLSCIPVHTKTVSMPLQRSITMGSRLCSRDNGWPDADALMNGDWSEPYQVESTFGGPQEIPDHERLHGVSGNDLRSPHEMSGHTLPSEVVQ